MTFAGVFASGAAAVTYLLFNVSWVDDGLGGRFLFFILSPDYRTGPPRQTEQGVVLAPSSPKALVED